MTTKAGMVWSKPDEWFERLLVWTWKWRLGWYAGWGGSNGWKSDFDTVPAMPCMYLWHPDKIILGICYGSSFPGDVPKWLTRLSYALSTYSFCIVHRVLLSESWMITRRVTSSTLVLTLQSIIFLLILASFYHKHTPEHMSCCISRGTFVPSSYMTSTIVKQHCLNTAIKLPIHTYPLSQIFQP